MLPLHAGAAADSRRSWIGRSDRALSKYGSSTRAPEALVRDHREEVSDTPTESLKPGRTGPPKVEAKPEPILLRAPIRAPAGRVSRRQDLELHGWHCLGTELIISAF